MNFDTHRVVSLTSLFILRDPKYRERDFEETFEGIPLRVLQVTNASRTLLCDIRTLAWDSSLLEMWGLCDSVTGSIGKDWKVVKETG